MNNNSLFDQDQSLPTLNLQGDHVSQSNCTRTSNLSQSLKMANLEGINTETLQDSQQSLCFVRVDQDYLLQLLHKQSPNANARMNDQNSGLGMNYN